MVVISGRRRHPPAGDAVGGSGPGYPRRMSSILPTLRRCRPGAMAPLLATLYLSVAAAQNAPAPPPARPGPLLPLTAGEVLAHVRRSVTWYHDLATVEQLSLPGVDPIARGQLQEQALTAVRLALHSARPRRTSSVARRRRTRGAGWREQERWHRGGKARRADPGGAARSRGGGSCGARVGARTEMAAAQCPAAPSEGRQARVRRSTRSALALSPLCSSCSRSSPTSASCAASRRMRSRDRASSRRACGRSWRHSRSRFPSSPRVPAGPVHRSSASSAATTPKTAAANFQPQSAGIVTLIQHWLTLHGYRGAARVGDRWRRRHSRAS